MSHVLRQTVTAAGLVLLSFALSGCIIYGGHPGGWCYWHPYACR